MKKSLSAGTLIGIGGTAYLACENKVLGASLFSLALLCICATGQKLYTGKIYRMPPVEKNESGGININIGIFVVLLCNYVAASLTGLIVGWAKPELIDKARQICTMKLSEGGKLVVLAFLCNILVYFAVEGFKAGYPVITIVCVMGFVLCGFEHSIANMFYFAVARMGGSDVAKYLICNVIFNSLGGIFAKSISE